MIERVVIDTNVLVSALWTPSGNASEIVAAIINRQLFLCYDYKILSEYRAVLSRPKFKFPATVVNELLAAFEKYGLSVAVNPSTFPMVDESDRVFYDVARACKAYLVTGNKKHYPDEPNIVTPREYVTIKG